MFARRLLWLSSGSCLVLLSGACQRAIGAAEERDPTELSAPPARGPQPAGSASPESAAPEPVPSHSAAAKSAARFPEPLGTASHAPREFGAPFSGAPSRELSAVLREPEAHAGAALTVTGTVKRVCQRKGCWMELSAGSDAATCRVKFKDYAFFVPKDAEGAKATLEGELVVQRVSASRVAHLEAEGAVFDNKSPDGSAIESQFVATSVRLQR